MCVRCGGVQELDARNGVNVGWAYRYLAGQPSRDSNRNEARGPGKENKSDGYEGDDNQEQNRRHEGCSDVPAHL